MAEPAIPQKLSALFPENILKTHNVKLSPANLISPGYDISWSLPKNLQLINLLNKGHISTIPGTGAYLQLMALWLYFKTLCISNASIEFLPFISPFGLTITPALSVEGKLCS
jgi:hypothetical protein